MANTGLDDVYVVIPNRARGYFLLDQASYDGLPPAGKSLGVVGGVYNAPLSDTSMKMPGGGVLSTPSDLMRFAAALLDGKLLKPETRDLMWTEQKTRSGEATGYGMGWGVSHRDGKLLVTHSGNQAGASSALVVDVTNRVGLAIMANISDADLTDLRKVLTGPLSPTGHYTSAPPAAPVVRLAPNEYLLAFQLGANRYSGRMTLDLDGTTARGTMAIDKPVRIDGTVAGTVTGDTLALHYPYTMREDGCVGDVTIKATINAARDGAQGSALVEGPCVPQPMTGTFTLAKR